MKRIDTEWWFSPGAAALLRLGEVFDELQFGCLPKCAPPPRFNVGISWFCLSFLPYVWVERSCSCRLGKWAEKGLVCTVSSSPNSVLGRQAICFCYLQMERAALKSPGPTDWKRSALVTSDYQPDGKFTIDEHPCYSTIPLRTGPSSKQPIEHTPLSARNVTAGRSKSNRELRMKEPVPVCLGSPPPPPPPAGTDRPFNRNTFHCAHQTVQPVEKSHIGPSGKRRPLRSERGRAKPAMNSGEPPANPTKQAVQHALGEV